MSLNPVSSGDPHVPAHNAERDAINNLEQEVNRRIPLPVGAATGDLLRWDGTQWLTTETRFFEGNGRPDGKVAAPVGSRYIDKTGAQGAVEWVKRAGGDTSDGWICLAGDTGRRNIASLFTVGNGKIWSAYVSRVGHVVDLWFDITMPSNQGGTVEILPALPGFSPGYARFAALQDNKENASTNGTLVQADGGITIYGVQGGKRDKFSGIWSTRDPWPSTLPGAST